MKTAIIKTDFWEEDRIFVLLPDARYFYLCLLTNPKRGTLPAFKCSDRLMSAYTGYNHDTIKLCKAHLTKAKLITILGEYYIINDDDYVTPTKGKLTQQLREKELASLPLEVKNFLLSRSGAVQEYNNNNNNKDNNSDKVITKNTDKVVKYTPKDVELTNLLHTLMQENSPNRPVRVPKDSDYEDINKMFRLDKIPYDGIEAVIRWCQQDSFWQSNIRSTGTLRRQYDKLEMQARRFYNDNQRNRTVEL